MKTPNALLLGLCLLLGSAGTITDLHAQQPNEPLPWWQQENPPLFDDQRWEEAIQAFEAKDKQSPPPEGAIVGIGSSSMLYWHDSISNDLSPLTIIPRGFGGSTMEDARYYAERIVIPYKPRAILLYEGDNDIGAFKLSPQQVLEIFNRFVARIHEALPNTRIYVISIKPSIARWAAWPQMAAANHLLQQACATDPRLTYIDMASPMMNEKGEPRKELFLADMLHLNDTGYEVWSAAIGSVMIPAEAQYEAESFTSGK